MRTSLALALVLSLGASALAQPDDPGLRVRIRERVRVAVEQKLIAQLALDPQTAQRFQQLLDRYDAQIAELQKDAGQAHKELKQFVDGGGNDPGTIYRLADRIIDDRARVQRLESERSRDVRQVLTPQQYGKLIVVYPQVAKELKQELWKALAEKRALRNGQPVQVPPELE
jgi:hypothetical protein